MIFIHAYSIYRKDRFQGRGGGVAILVQKGLSTSPLEILVSDPGDIYNTYFLGIRIRTDLGWIDVVVYYPPSLEPKIET